MKTLLTLTLSLLLTTGAIAQTYLTQAKPADKKEWGYINEKGEWVIEPQYRKCYKFSEGYAPIYEGKKFFFINPKGEKLKTEVGNFKLYNVFGMGIQGFSDGMVPILVGKKWGYMNTNGEMAIGLKYEKALKFDNGFAVVRKNGDFFVINKQGEEFVVNGAIDCKPFSEGLAPFRAANKMFGFAGTDGKTVIKAQFASVGYFIDGLAWAKTIDKKVGFINKKGEWVIEAKFLAVRNFDSVIGLAMVKKESGWVFVDKTGKIISTHSDGTPFLPRPFPLKIKDGLGKGVEMESKKTGYFNKDMKWAIEPQFDGGRDFKNGFCAAKKGDKWGFINKKGEWVIEPIFSGVKDMELIK